MRQAVSTGLSPLQFVARTPYWVGDGLSSTLSSRDALQTENAALERRVLELSQVTQQYSALKAENEDLRRLLGSKPRVPHEVLVAELVGVVPTGNTHQIIIDKGTDAGVQIGQAVVDAQGLLGQVVEVTAYTSRVLLVTDPAHAVPVQINRTGARSIAGGSGAIDRLMLEDLPITADVRKGDLIVTSGLGGRFPRGYPVGFVDSVLVEPTAAFAVVGVRPAASVGRSRHVLILFGPQGNPS